MERFINVEKEYSEEINFCPLEDATHLIRIEDEFSTEIDGMDFSEVKSYISDGYKPCIAKESKKIVIEMDELSAKQLMFILQHFSQLNSDVFYPLVCSSEKEQEETLLDKLDNVVGLNETNYRMDSRNLFGHPALTLREVK